MVAPKIPGYWMNETSGVLRPAILAYLNQEPLTEEHIVTLRAYFRLWVAAEFAGPAIETLRRNVDCINSRRTVKAWLEQAEHADIDPI